MPRPSTSAPARAGSGRPPTAAPTGRTSPTAPSGRPPWERSRSSDADPNVVYAGTGEACIRVDVSHGDGVYRSTDGGATWSNVGLADTRHIGRIRIHPEDPDLVYVAALGHAFGPNEQRGVFRSRDGGATWERVLHRNAETGAIDLCIDPTNPRVLYAALWQVIRRPWILESGGPGSGIFKSTDGGDTWTEISGNPGLPEGIKGRIGIACSPAKAGTGVGDRRGGEGRAAPFRGRRRQLGGGERRARPAPAPLVLPPRVRRPAGRRHRLGAQPASVEVHRRRQDLHRGVDPARRQPRPVDRPGRSRAA